MVQPYNLCPISVAQMMTSSELPVSAIYKLPSKTGAYTRGGVHRVQVHPPPHLGKKFRSEMFKRGEKVPPRYVGKKECARSAQIRQN